MRQSHSNEELISFFKDSILKAEKNEKEKELAEEFLHEYAGSLSAALSAYSNADIEVRAGDDLSTMLSKATSRIGKRIRCVTQSAPVQTTYSPQSITFGLKGRSAIGTIGEYKPDPTAYFPVQVCYGDRELSCSNHAEVASSLKVMANDSMGHIIKELKRRVGKEDTKKK